jgi:hypothetical protein
MNSALSALEHQKPVGAKRDSLKKVCQCLLCSPRVYLMIQLLDFKLATSSTVSFKRSDFHRKERVRRKEIFDIVCQDVMFWYSGIIRPTATRTIKSRPMASCPTTTCFIGQLPRLAIRPLDNSPHKNSPYG